MPAQLVAYSGFSATNYIQEAYSADLDFGVGEWSVGGWVKTLQPANGGNYLTYSENIAAWDTGASVTVTSNTNVAPNGTTTADTLTRNSVGSGAFSDIVLITPTSVNGNKGKTYTFSVWLWVASGTLECSLAISDANFNTYTVGISVSNTPTRFSYTSSGGPNGWNTNGVSIAAGISLPFNTSIVMWGAQLELGATVSGYKPTTSTPITPKSLIVERGNMLSPTLMLGMDDAGRFVATALDGTTTRTAVTTAAYNNGVFTKVDAFYQTSGKLSIWVNGQEMASAVGAPLLTMSNPNAVLTIGNSRTLDAAFPGSITMLKIGATVPTPEQALWMYEQEKSMFRAGAQVTLPSDGSVLDLAYDESQDKWVAVQDNYESAFTGLIRTSSAAVSSGTFHQAAAKSGVKLLARVGASAGVDITMPALSLKEELVRRAEAAAKASKTLVPFPFDAIAGQTDFQVPMGWTATEVLNNGASQREGATKHWVRLFDGFRETVRFAVAPGAAAWIQITARKE